jgi:hypothetical protein
MSETDEDRQLPEAGESSPVDDIPSNVPDPDAPLRGEKVPDDWLDPRFWTPSGRPGN